MGAIGDPYVSLTELKSYMSIPVDKVSLDDNLTWALESASQEIERHCNRQFNKAGEASSRVYEPTTWRLVEVDDFYDTDGLKVEVDSAANGGFGQELPASQYELSPFNGIVDGQPGWPYWKVRSNGLRFIQRPHFGNRATVRVTAKWGWAAVPAPVKQACLILAAETFQLKDAPFGVAGMDAFGSPLRVRDNAMARSKLTRFKREAVQVG